MRIKIVCLIAICFTIVASPLAAQEWSSAQKEVWKNVEAYWSLASKGDVEGFLNYFHEDFSGWINGAHLPHDLATRAKFMRFSFPRSTTLMYDIKPLAIKIHGNVAIVQYVYSEMNQDKDGKEENQQGRWTDVLMKSGDNWVMIADHGGANASDD